MSSIFMMWTAQSNGIMNKEKETDSALCTKCECSIQGGCHNMATNHFISDQQFW